MPCYHPVDIWISSHVKDNGKRDVIHNFDSRKHEGHYSQSQRRCGNCIGCRIDRSREWAVRCVHEASLYEDNSFITLTFSDEYLYTRPNPWSLQRGQGSEFQLFMKRLRKAYGKNIRFYMCGEYGENCFNCFKHERYCNCDKYIPTIGRPHYHAIIFNFDFMDKKYYKSINGKRLYTSDALQDLWTCPKFKIPMGFCSLGDVTIESAAYVARYIMKKITGDKAEEPNEDTGLTHYERFDPRTGEIHVLEPEYNNMSRMPGIGMRWLEQFYSEVLINDSVLNKEYPAPVPKYYDKLLERIAPMYLEANKDGRIDIATKHVHDNTPERLAVREYVLQQKLSQLHRKDL